MICVESLEIQLRAGDSRARGVLARRMVGTDAAQARESAARAVLATDPAPDTVASVLADPEPTLALHTAGWLYRRVK